MRKLITGISIGLSLLTGATGIVQGYSVITSYSIHYTKLYDRIAHHQEREGQRERDGLFERKSFFHRFLLVPAAARADQRFGFFVPKVALSPAISWVFSSLLSRASGWVGR